MTSNCFQTQKEKKVNTTIRLYVANYLCPDSFYGYFEDHSKMLITDEGSKLSNLNLYRLKENNFLYQMIVL